MGTRRYGKRVQQRKDIFDTHAGSVLLIVCPAARSHYYRVTCRVVAAIRTERSYLIVIIPECMFVRAHGGF